MTTTHGSFTVERRRVSGGLWEYRVSAPARKGQLLLNLGGGK